MPRRNAPYPLEFRQQMIELVSAGRTPEELSREFEPSAQAIRNWVAQAERVGRHLNRRDIFKKNRSAALAEWRQLGA